MKYKRGRWYFIRLKGSKEYFPAQYSHEDRCWTNCDTWYDLHNEVAEIITEGLLCDYLQESYWDEFSGQYKESKLWIELDELLQKNGYYLEPYDNTIFCIVEL